MPASAGDVLKVGVMGAGSVGSYFGGRLAQQGVPVTLVARQAHVDAIARDGLRIDSVLGPATVSLAATTDVGALRDVDLVLVSVKTVDSEAVADALAPVIDPAIVLVTVQNGVDSAWRIAARIPNAVVPAVVYVSTEMAGPGCVRHNGAGQLIFGEPLGPDPARADRLVSALGAAFERAGVSCRRSDDIMVDLWTKLTTNCAYNAVSALARLRYRHIAADEGGRAIMQAVVEESAAVARAARVPVEQATLEAAVRRIVEVAPDAISSTAQDVMQGRRTEIDDLNGYLVRRGTELGVPTPVNRALQTLVALLERSVRGAGQ